VRNSVIDFKRAIRESLRVLIENNDRITNVKIIEAARLSCGKPVGKSTLYRKNDKTKEFVYQDLLLEIDVAKDTKAKLGGKSSKLETISSLRAQLTELKKENQSLVDQVCSQESIIESNSAENNIDNSILNKFQEDVYILSKVLSILHPRYNGYQKEVLSYETKFRDDDRIFEAKKTVKEVISDIERSTFSNITNIK